MGYLTVASLIATLNHSCIVFSGFNEFEYVKRAIKLGVVDYIEKPLTSNKVEQAIKKTLEQMKEKNDYRLLKEKWVEGEKELLAKACLDLLKSGGETLAKWRAWFGHDAEKVVGVTVIACSKSFKPVSTHPDYRIIPVYDGEEHLLVLFHFSPLTKKRIENLLTTSDNVVFGIGRTYIDLKASAKSYQEAVKAMWQGIFFGEVGWKHFEDTVNQGESVVELSKRKQLLLLSLRTRDREGFHQKLDEFTYSMVERRIDPEVVKGKMLRIIYLSMEVAKEIREDTSSLWREGYLPHKEVANLHSSVEIFHWFRHQMHQIFQWIDKNQQKPIHIAIERALRFIHLNYHTELSLQEVAEHSNMSTTYFSVLFKEQMGESYIKYVTKMRIEHAKKLLKSGAKVNEVSEKVGYYNYRHFSELFKKHVGMTPGHYRDRQSQA